MNLESIRGLLRYNDWANAEIVRASGPLTDGLLDRPFDMGRGTLRITLMHIWAGESVWISRWQGRTETPWPREEEKLPVSAIAERFAPVRRERDAFLATLKDADLARIVPYRDSKGGLFKALLGDMMTQMFIHSTHHRSQAVNMIRQTTGQTVELDYMMWLRQPA